MYHNKLFRSNKDHTKNVASFEDYTKVVKRSKDLATAKEKMKTIKDYMGYDLWANTVHVLHRQICLQKLQLITKM
jgi:hypothetical protein